MEESTYPALYRSDEARARTLGWTVHRACSHALRTRPAMQGQTEGGCSNEKKGRERESTGCSNTSVGTMARRELRKAIDFKPDDATISLNQRKTMQYTPKRKRNQENKLTFRLASRSRSSRPNILPPYSTLTSIPYSDSLSPSLFLPLRPHPPTPLGTNGSAPIELRGDTFGGFSKAPANPNARHLPVSDSSESFLNATLGASVFSPPELPPAPRVQSAVHTKMRGDLAAFLGGFRKGNRPLIAAHSDWPVMSRPTTPSIYYGAEFLDLPTSLFTLRLDDSDEGGTLPGKRLVTFR
ncbi:hypothetical protein DFP72DRAFT_860377 [Ephemerocybe angulata]|uniref:Uncharacterized protein n=1 Tax=Ephemerocybe angulata TaxID=980116 RepID=A0A8H6HAX9_9AGAR|nr:hypothetical protein DFP72DRAFT_860377 [Tulosesus angulatus]